MNRLRTASIGILAALVLFLSACPSWGQGQFGVGGKAPDFTLQDVYGRNHTLSAMKKHSLIVLYFFNTESAASQEGLLSLNRLIGKFGNTDLLVWGITTSSKSAVSDFIVKHKAGFPVMIDGAGVSEVYQAQLILPTVVIIGPEFKVIDFFQGGGQTTEKMLMSLAEKVLQRDAPLVAEAISQEVQQKNPANVKAKTVYGYAALKAGKADKAKETFSSMKQEPGEAGVVADEGLAAVYAQQGKNEQALQHVAAVEQKAPDRGYVHKVKGDILYSQNKPKEALAEYQQAANKPVAEDYQKSESHNKLGRLYASTGQHDQARLEYDKAVAIDPYNVVAMSNKGVSYQKEGDMGKAVQMFQQANTVRDTDVYAAMLARQAQHMLELQKDIANKNRTDTLVKELAERFRQQQAQPAAASQDTWTSRPMILSFFDFQDKGGLSERDGLSLVLTSQLADLLNQSGRVQVVERVVLDRLLGELNLGSSELADQETALKLGRVLAAKLIGTGSLLHAPDSSFLTLRMVDSETTAIPKVLTAKIASGSADLDKEILALNREILRAVIEKYPLQGFVVQGGESQVTLNLGARQGVVKGAHFDVIEDGKPVEYKGKTLRGIGRTVARVEAVQVEPDMTLARVLRQERPLAQDDKVLEVAVAAIGQGGENVVR